MAIETLTSGSLRAPYMPMTIQALDCPPPVLEKDFDNCRIPGGVDLWSNGGFYSPGRCFVGYEAACTQTEVPKSEWPIAKEETVVRCIPSGFECNNEDGNPRFATTEYDGTTLSAPAFEIRWRSQDLTVDKTKDSLSVMRIGQLNTLSIGDGSTMMSTPLPASNEQSGSAVTSTPAPTENVSAPSASQDLQSKSKLTSGSIAGIAIGASLGTVGGALIAIFLLLKRRKHNQENGRSRRGSSSQVTIASAPGPAVLPNQPPVEMAHQPLGPRELDASTISPLTPKSQDTIPFRPDVSHVSLNTIPVEMEGEPVEGSTKKEDAEAKEV